MVGVAGKFGVRGSLSMPARFGMADEKTCRALLGWTGRNARRHTGFAGTGECARPYESLLEAGGGGWMACAEGDSDSALRVESCGGGPVDFVGANDAGATAG